MYTSRVTGTLGRGWLLLSVVWGNRYEKKVTVESVWYKHGDTLENDTRSTTDWKCLNSRFIRRQRPGLVGGDSAVCDRRLPDSRTGTTWRRRGTSEIKFPEINCVAELLAGFVNHSGARDRTIKQRLRGLSLKNHNDVGPGAQYDYGVDAAPSSNRAPIDTSLTDRLCVRLRPSGKDDVCFSVAPYAFYDPSALSIFFFEGGSKARLFGVSGFETLLYICFDLSDVTNYCTRKI